MSAIKLGNYYITKNDPRFLLRKVKELTDENQKYREVIKKARLYVDERSEFTHRDVYRNIHNGKAEYVMAGKVFFGDVDKLLDILKEVE